MEGYLAEIRMFAGNFAPRAWQYCQGQLLPISQYNALFSLLGCMYGGDCRTTFALPDFRGRTAVGVGSGPGLSTINLAERAGIEYTTLNLTNLPAHNHTASLHAETAIGTSANPDGKMLAGLAKAYAVPNPADNKTMGSESIVVNNAGGSQAFSNMQPFLGMNYIICIQGLFPSRN